MSGHNKWSTIKRKKGAADSKRSKIFSRISKEITIAVKEGGGTDPQMNPRLRTAIINAKGVNMPKDAIQRALSKGEGGSENYSEVTFEGTAQAGVALFIECLTDNNLRTVGNIRSIFNKRGGTLGKNGSLHFLFDRKGIFTIPIGIHNIEELELELIDAGLEDIEETGDHLILTTAIEDFGHMQKKLEELKIEPENSELQRIPNTRKIVGLDAAKKILKLIEMLEDDDDVQNVFHDMEMTEEIEKALEE
jgi:YebC/PmpR family DNA-binding regulatory protein